LLSAQRRSKSTNSAFAFGTQGDIVAIAILYIYAIGISAQVNMQYIYVSGLKSNFVHLKWIAALPLVNIILRGNATVTNNKLNLLSA
jgi:hypothetical protein